MSRARLDSSTFHGAACGLAAAALFGMSAPFSKRLLSDASPLTLAGLLYAGGGIGLVFASRIRRDRGREAPLRAADVPWLLTAIALGGVAAPVLMLVGFERVSGVAGALLLNLEAPFTVLVATLLFREHIGRRGAFAVALVVLGALALARPSSGRGDALGALATAGACLLWAIENNIAQRLSCRDPWAVARTKLLGAAVCSLALARLSGATMPGPGTVAAAFAVGAAGYGASNVLHLAAMRSLGAARQAALFATAPFVGALAAVPVLGERPGAWVFVAALLMAAGVVLLLSERHSHRHGHERLEHDHAHDHGDGHHAHAHEPPFSGTHAHPHAHETLEHEHPHLPDEHHRHEHD